MPIPVGGDAVKIAQILVVAAIGVLTYRKEMLNALGAFTAVAMGAAIVWTTSILWLLLLFSFLALGSAATRLNYAEKAKRHVAEKNGGRRSTRNVIANGLAPALIAVFSGMISGQWGPGVAAVGYVSAVAVGAADTLASEFGSLATRVRMITTLKPVPAGVDGGVSTIGQVAALGGATIITALGALFTGVVPAGGDVMPLTPVALAIPIVMGFLGCQVDSVLGATLEGGGIFTKEETNLVSIAVGGIGGIAAAVLLLG